MAENREIAEVAREVGFDLVGIAPLRPPRGADRFQAWLDAGRQADMGWFERQRKRILDPRRILQRGKSLLVLGLGHARAPVEIQGGGRIARYAAGRDYHNLMGRLLKKLARKLRRTGSEASRGIVDAGPLLERSHAAEAGLGFESKSANLLHHHWGPWFFLAELILERELEPESTSVTGSCGTCRACIDACPTGAILEPGAVDARLCISYQTIENRGEIPRELRPQLGGWLFGCDICSEVCPFGTTAAGGSERFGTHAVVENYSLIDWLKADSKQLVDPLRGSPLRRPRREGLARNAALALARHPSDDGRDTLLAALAEDGSAIVREAAGWSLAAAHAEDRASAPALEQAHARASDPAERNGLRTSLDELSARRKA